MNTLLPQNPENTPEGGLLESNCCASSILRLTLKKKWFDMIASGEKCEEYRTPSKWILSRLEGKEYDVLEFKNGYGPNVPTMQVEFLGWHHFTGRPEWGFEGWKPVVVIQLGRVISIQHNA
jgi:hypothetical protein